MIAGLGILIGVVIGALSGGSLLRLQHIHLKWELPILLLFMIQGLARGRLPGVSAAVAGLLVWMLCNVAIVVLLAWDANTPGIPTVMTGVGLNLLAVLLNSGMPVSIGTPSSSSAAALQAAAGFYHPLANHSLAPALADVLPLGMWGGRGVFSVGDLALLCGCVALVTYGMTLGNHATDGSDRTWSDSRSDSASQ